LTPRSRRWLQRPTIDTDLTWKSTACSNTIISKSSRVDITTVETNINMKAAERFRRSLSACPPRTSFALNLNGLPDVSRKPDRQHRRDAVEHAFPERMVRCPLEHRRSRELAGNEIAMPQ
jgi:hypothetical protein